MHTKTLPEFVEPVGSLGWVTDFYHIVCHKNEARKAIEKDREGDGERREKDRERQKERKKGRAIECGADK